MANQSSYHKLKAANIKLRKQLAILATNPDSMEGILIKAEWVLLTETEAALWMGSNVMPTVFTGLLNKISNGKQKIY